MLFTQKFKLFSLLFAAAIASAAPVKDVQQDQLIGQEGDVFQSHHRLPMMHADLQAIVTKDKSDIKPYRLLTWPPIDRVIEQDFFKRAASGPSPGGNGGGSPTPRPGTPPARTNTNTAPLSTPPNRITGTPEAPGAPRPSRHRDPNEIPPHGSRPGSPTPHGPQHRSGTSAPAPGRNGHSNTPPPSYDSVSPPPPPHSSNSPPPSYDSLSHHSRPPSPSPH